MAQMEEQQHPPTEQPPADVTPGSGDVSMRKAAAKEDLAFLTSGAKEKMDKTLAGMKGAAHIMTHPFNKEAKEAATAKTIQQKNEIADKQERIRATAHIQLLQEKAAADGVDLGAGSGPTPAPIVGAERQENGEAGSAPAPDQARKENESSASGDGAGYAPAPAPDQAGKENESSASGDKMSEDSSDGSSRGRGRALAQIPPDSQDYQSG
ncbi:unnamed protein product [Calypogeia fissa]